MNKIDAHQHYWFFNKKDYGWMGEDMSKIQKDCLPPELSVELKKTGYIGTVAVEARQTEDENFFLLDLANSYPFIKGIVGWVDLCSENVENRLDYFSKFPKFSGVRHVLHDEPDDDFMLRSDFLRGISHLKKYNLTYDILIFPRHLPNSIKFVEKFPEQKFVVDHIAKPGIRNKEIEPWASGMKELAKFENVFCKLSGLVTETHWNHWTKEDFMPYLETLLDVFGPDRLMIGSDWPVCTVAGDYSSVVNIVESFIPPEYSEKILSQNAINFYNLKID
jgi:L-fuconolactonase